MTIHRIQRTLVLILFVVPLSLFTDTIAAASTPDVVSKTAGASEVADMVLFLASYQARHISGQLVGVCGNFEWEI